MANFQQVKNVMWADFEAISSKIACHTIAIINWDQHAALVSVEFVKFDRNTLVIFTFIRTYFNQNGGFLTYHTEVEWNIRCYTCSAGSLSFKSRPFTYCWCTHSGFKSPGPSAIVLLFVIFLHAYEHFVYCTPSTGGLHSRFQFHFPAPSYTAHFWRLHLFLLLNMIRAFLASSVQLYWRCHSSN